MKPQWCFFIAVLFVVSSVAVPLHHARRVPFVEENYLHSEDARTIPVHRSRPLSANDQRHLQKDRFLANTEIRSEKLSLGDPDENLADDDIIVAGEGLKGEQPRQDQGLSFTGLPGGLVRPSSPGGANLQATNAQVKLPDQSETAQLPQTQAIGATFPAQRVNENLDGTFDASGINAPDAQLNAISKAQAPAGDIGVQPPAVPGATVGADDAPKLAGAFQGLSTGAQGVTLNQAQGQLPSANGQLPGANGELPSVNGQLPTANGQLPTANGQLPTANGQLPTANGQLPAANGQFQGLQTPNLVATNQLTNNQGSATLPASSSAQLLQTGQNAQRPALPTNPPSDVGIQPTTPPDAGAPTEPESAPTPATDGVVADQELDSLIQETEAQTTTTEGTTEADSTDGTTEADTATQPPATTTVRPRHRGTKFILKQSQSLPGAPATTTLPSTQPTSPPGQDDAEQVAQELTANMPDMSDLNGKQPIQTTGDSETTTGGSGTAETTTQLAVQAVTVAIRPPTQPCRRGDKGARCVHIIQNGKIYGPYMLNDLIERLGHTARRVAITVKGKRINGTLFGPLKTKLKSDLARKSVRWEPPSPPRR